MQSSKTLFQLGLGSVSDLLNTACGSRLAVSKRYPTALFGDFCDSKDSVITKEFLPLVAEELEKSQDVFDRIVALAALGSLGTEEVVPVLLPIIRGTPGQYDDTAERVRAILSLQRVVFTAPEKVYKFLLSIRFYETFFKIESLCLTFRFTLFWLVWLPIKANVKKFVWPPSVFC